MNAAVDSAETTNPALIMRVALEGFEGPLDLLLHLIQKHELDIRSIPIRFIAQEYLRYLEAMVRLDLGVAGEYLVMAATLLHIKSVSLLPKDENDDGDDDGLDPREELIRRLLQYQQFKFAAQTLVDLPQLHREHFVRPEMAIEVKTVPTSLDEIEVPQLFELVEIYRTILSRQKTVTVHEVTRHELSIKDGIHRIASALDDLPRRSLAELAELLDSPDPRHAMVIAFMSVLEMAKLRMVRVFQLRLSSDDLIVERAVLDIRDVALALDFSDPGTVLSREEAAMDTEPLPEPDFDEDAELAARLHRPRRRKAKPVVVATDAPVTDAPVTEDMPTLAMDGLDAQRDEAPTADALVATVEATAAEETSPNGDDFDASLEDGGSRAPRAAADSSDSLDDAMLAFAAIRPDLDDYDVEAVLAFAARIGTRATDEPEDGLADDAGDDLSDDASDALSDDGDASDVDLDDDLSPTEEPL